MTSTTRTDSFVQTVTETEDGRVETTQFQRARIQFRITRCDQDGETVISVELRDLDDDVDATAWHRDVFAGYEGDMSGMGVCPVAAARSFVDHVIDRKVNPDHYGERALAPYGREWELEQEARYSPAA